MGVGDLVKFVAPAVFKSAERDYPSTGIIIKVKQNPTSHESYVVHWSSGKQTTEHFSYLKELADED